ncbi:MAG: OB-fold nucleic acid binding domain-containing protein [Candidatus Woesearchaeota archaeon]
MITVPYDQIIAKIKAATGLTDSEIETMINEKLEQLSGLISKEGAAHIIANEHDVKIFPEQGGTLPIKELHPGSKNVNTAGKVVKKYEVREFKTEKRQGKVGSFLLGDNDGLIRVVLWNDQADLFSKFNEGDIIKVQNAYVRDNNGRAEMHLNENSKLEVNPEGITIQRAQGPGARPQATRKTIKELGDNEQNAEVLATIVQTYDPTFFEVCSQCNKRAQLKDGKYECATHGEVKPDFAYVMNVYLDDGTDNIRAVLWRESAQSLLQKTHAEILKFKDKPESFEPMKTELLGTIVLTSGKTQKNESFGRVEFVVNKIRKANPEDAEAGKKDDSGKPTTPSTPEKKEQKPAPKQETPNAAQVPPKEYDDDLELDEELVNLDDL